MKKKYYSFGETKEMINNSLTDVTKCYILINYAFGSDEDKKLYCDEFKKRYINFYKTISNISSDIDELYIDDTCDIYKKILNIDFYNSKMHFLDHFDIGKDIEEEDDTIDIDYEVKASMSAVKLNFYHNSNIEFGPNTRFHVDASKLGVIDPKARNEEEAAFVFSALTEYFINKYYNDLKKDSMKLIKKNM